MPNIFFIVEGLDGALHRIAAPVQAGESLLEAALRNGIPLQHACEGCCACSTCHVVVQAGGHSLTPIEEPEEDRLDYVWDGQDGSRLGCQARVGDQDLTVRVPRYSLDPAKYQAGLAARSSPEMGPSAGGEPANEGETPLNCLRWDDAEAVAQALELHHGQDVQLDALRFTTLLEWIVELPGFSGRLEESNESRLEAILSAWFELREED